MGINFDTDNQVLSVCALETVKGIYFLLDVAVFLVRISGIIAAFE